MAHSFIVLHGINWVVALSSSQLFSTMQDCITKTLGVTPERGEAGISLKLFSKEMLPIGNVLQVELAYQISLNIQYSASTISIRAGQKR